MSYEFEFEIETIDLERYVIDVLYRPVGNDELRSHRINNIGIEESVVDAFVDGKLSKSKFLKKLEEHIDLTSHEVIRRWDRQMKVKNAPDVSSMLGQGGSGSVDFTPVENNDNIPITLPAESDNVMINSYEVSHAEEV